MAEVRLRGFILIPAEVRAEVLPLLDEHIRLTRGEPGCLAFDLTETAPGSGCFAVSERFADRAAFETHQRRAGASAWGEASRGFVRDYATSESAGDGAAEDGAVDDGAAPTAVLASPRGRG